MTISFTELKLRRFLVTYIETKISVADVNRLNERFSRIGLDLQIITRDADIIIQELADTLATIYVESHKAMESECSDVVFGTDEYDEPTD